MDTYEYSIGLERLTTCYMELIELEELLQSGGSTKNPQYENLKRQSSILDKVFPPTRRKAIYNTLRSSIKIALGATATVVSGGFGADTLVNALYAIVSTLNLTTIFTDLLSLMFSAKNLFGKLFAINRNKRIPIVSRISLDSGFIEFEHKFETILSRNIHTYGPKLLSTIYNNIIKLIDSLITNVSDWIACLFPDTAGVAGEIANQILTYVTRHGYTLIYNLISLLSTSFQKLITNSIGLKIYIHDAMEFLLDLVTRLDPKQINEIITSIGSSISDSTSNQLVKSSTKYGTKIASAYADLTLKSYNLFKSKFSFIPTAQTMLIYVIKKLIIPNINTCVDLFNQVFPLYLMFTLFIEIYPKMTQHKTPTKGQSKTKQQHTSVKSKSTTMSTKSNSPTKSD